MRTLRWLVQETIVVLLWQGILLVGNTDSMAAKRATKSAVVPGNTGRHPGGRSFEFARRLRQGRASDDMLVQRDNAVHEWSLSDYVMYRRAVDRKRRENPPGFDHITATGHSPTRRVPLNGATTPAAPPASTPVPRCYYYGCSGENAGPPACYFTLHSRDVPPNVPCVCVCSADAAADASGLTTPAVPSGFDDEYEDYHAALNSRTPRRGDVNNSISVIVFLVIYMFVVIGYLKLTVKWY